MRTKIEELQSIIKNLLLDLWSAGQTSAANVQVEDVGWCIGTKEDRWIILLTNVDRKSEPLLIRELYRLLKQTEYGQEPIDIYTEPIDDKDGESQ